MSKFEDGSYGSLTGIALIGKVLAGRCSMKYTRAAVGNGEVPEGMTPKTMDGPAGYIMDGKISAVTNPVDGECQVTVQIKSDDVETGFYATCIVLYAEDPDEGEVPYTYLYLENEPEWIRPASSIVGKLATFDIIAAVGDVDAVTAVIDPEAIVTIGQAKQLIADHNIGPNAHMELFEQYAKKGSTPPLDETGKIPTEFLPADVLKQSGAINTVITIPADAWQTDDNGPRAYRAEVVCEQSTSEHIPYVSVDSPSIDTATDCGLYDKSETAEGVLRFWADSVPTADITARIALFGSGGIPVTSGVLPAASSERLGAVKVGAGLNITEDGTLSIDTADEAEVNEMLAEVLTSDSK